jgi:hypothetical protein
MPFRPTRPLVAGGPIVTLIQGTPVPDHATGRYAPNANRTDHGLFLVIQPVDTDEGSYLAVDGPDGWTIGSAPPGLQFLPPDFDAGDLEFCGYTRIGEIRA